MTRKLTIRMKEQEIPPVGVENEDTNKQMKIAISIPSKAPAKTVSKRSQVKVACANCRKACKKCDDIRPCIRCTKYNVECFDAVGTKRRDKKGQRKSKVLTPTEPKNTPSLYPSSEGVLHLGAQPRDRFPSASSLFSLPESEANSEKGQLKILSDVCGLFLDKSGSIPLEIQFPARHLQEKGGFEREAMYFEQTISK